MARVIPNYALYGDQAQPGWHNSFDFEWIPQRSRPYNWEIQPHLHDAFVQILYLTEGSVEVQLDNAKWLARAPCLLLIPAQTVHGFHFSTDVNGPVVTATQRPLESLAAVLMPELVQTLRKPAVILLDDASRHAEALMPLFLAIERESRMHAIGQVAAGMSLITAVLVQIARLGDLMQPTPLTVSSRKTQQIEKFRALVDEHFKKHLAMSAYASQLGITPGQLSRLCREVLGISSLEVINARLVHEAQRDLVYTSVSIKQLAGQLGFADEAYFGRFFRKHTGLSPREFRARALQALLKPEGDGVRSSRAQPTSVATPLLNQAPARR
ncbi:helix-turn-helix domain-containing protein [Ramlibacter sp. 2FC]|uniref:helix-turn-helix domain-containing protein n=1 Tax=Ramlibacter sp. 2FC TaxID=2502188 RepID=UPI0010F80D50|nr:helix-turn-helix domain-containing protein [Ramlibacter sp. 2FC]